MASGFMSSVSRLFHSKGKDRTSRHHPDVHGKTLVDSTSPASASSRSSAPKKRNHPKASNLENCSPDRVVRKRDQNKRKSSLFSSLRKRTRPLSCFVARPESPTNSTRDRLSTDEETKEARHNDDKRREEAQSGSQQRKEKKPRRPLSCIVQPPSPRMMPSVEQFPELQKGILTKKPEVCSGNTAEAPRKASQRPRPVSCFVEPPPQRCPPPYPGRPGQPPRHIAEELNHPRIGILKQIPPSYSEASRRPPQIAPVSRQFDGEDGRRSFTYDRVLSQPSLLSSSETSQMPLYPSSMREPNPAYFEIRKEPSSHYTEAPRQSTPVMNNYRLSKPLTCRDMNCFLDPCPFQPSPQPPTYGGHNYDLKTYFPPSAPARRPARPQSACFLCEPQRCCVQAQRPCRPMSQCYYPGCDFSLPGSYPSSLPAEIQYQPAQEISPKRDEQPRIENQAPPNIALSQIPQTSTADSSSPSIVPSSPEHSLQPMVVHQEKHPAPPRPKKRTLIPRPKSTCLLPAESESTSTTAPRQSSPRPSPRPPRSALKKYRSADCLDRVDELESLHISPPPAKPLSHFTSDSDTQPETTQSDKHQEEIFTSVEMLEKLGQPRSRSHQQRPVSCFVGSSADESGYLSAATLGGSGWLGGLSASTGDILEALDGEELNVADDELSFERASSLRKAWSVCSLLREDSIQDRSFTVMRRRRQKMKDRHHTNTRSSSTETDEGVDVKTGNSTSSLLDKEGESATVAGIPLDGKRLTLGSRGPVPRLPSSHMKAWQIRLHRKQMMRKRRSYERLHPRIETLV